MKTVFSVITGIVLALVIFIGVGAVALHHLFSSMHGTPGQSAPVVANQAASANNSIAAANGTQSNTSSVNSGLSNSASPSSSAGTTTNTTNSTASSTKSSTNVTNSANSSGTSTAQTTGSVSSSEQKSMASTIQALLENPSGGPIDCSALVQYVYGQAGVKVPRTVSQQASIGAHIPSPDQLSYGDIVFFDLTSQPNSPSFDGIYVGGGQFVARTTHGIMKMQLGSTYWKDKFMYGEQASS